MKVLVTGGVRSGKSWHAEQLLEGYDGVTYVAPGPTVAEDSDPDWVARIAAHQARRSSTWTTYETRDLAGAIASGGPVLVDCLGTWLTATIDVAKAWEELYGIEPNASAAYGMAIKAVEDAAVPVVSPTNERATLGTVLAQIEQQADWTLPMEREHDRAPSRAVLIGMMRLLWHGPARSSRRAAVGAG